MEEIFSSETSVDFYLTMLNYITDDNAVRAERYMNISRVTDKTTAKFYDKWGLSALMTNKNTLYIVQ
jgi:hypothetical protein